MSLTNLDNLVKTGQLKKELSNKSEFDGLLNSGRARLEDAKNATLNHESRFDLAYNSVIINGPLILFSSPRILYVFRK
jgi:hypothetical protein